MQLIETRFTLYKLEGNNKLLVRKKVDESEGIKTR
jgi:hypothetical protein